MSLAVGITGGIGCGKSTVAGVFAAIGVPVYDSDSRAKMLMTTSLKDQLINIAGADIFTTPHGEMNRKLLSSMLFGDNELKARVEALVHPAVVADFRQWAACRQYPYTIMESALLFSSPHLGGVVDKTVVVLCSASLAIARCTKRDNISEQQVQARMDHQMPPMEAEKLADFVIRNDEKELLMPQILKLHDIFINFAVV